MEHSRFIENIQNQIREENKGENILILPLSSFSYFAYDIAEKKYYLFALDEENINKDSKNVDLRIIDTKSWEYAIFSVDITVLTVRSLGQPRIKFTEELIMRFNQIENKEELINLFNKIN